MPNNGNDDMDDAPITRRELREELKAVEQGTEAWGGALLHAIQQLPTRADLEKMRAETRAELDRRFADVDKRFAQVERHVSTEIGPLAAIDEKYADLPARVARVEDQLLKPKP